MKESFEDLDAVRLPFDFYPFALFSIRDRRSFSTLNLIDLVNTSNTLLINILDAGDRKQQPRKYAIGEKKRGKKSTRNND